MDNFKDVWGDYKSIYFMVCTTGWPGDKCLMGIYFLFISFIRYYKVSLETLKLGALYRNVMLEGKLN